VIVLGPSEGRDPTELRVRFSDGSVDDWPVGDFSWPHWRAGAVVSVDTEDGLERGVVVLGPSRCGAPPHPPPSYVERNGCRMQERRSARASCALCGRHR
jgi:hypothetical protein